MRAIALRPGHRFQSRDGRWHVASAVDPNLDGHVEIVTHAGDTFVVRGTAEVPTMQPVCRERPPGPWDDFPRLR